VIDWIAARSQLILSQRKRAPQAHTGIRPVARAAPNPRNLPIFSEVRPGPSNAVTAY
jgi:hypothetical protein